MIVSAKALSIIGVAVAAVGVVVLGFAALIVWSSQRAYEGIIQIGLVTALGGTLIHIGGRIVEQLEVAVHYLRTTRNIAVKNAKGTSNA